MADQPRSVITYRVTFVLLVAAVMFAQLLPLRPGPGGIPGPDIILLIALAWIAMRPDYVVILPWNLRDEIAEQLAYVREWGGQFVTAVPGLEVS